MKKASFFLMLATCLLTRKELITQQEVLDELKVIKVRDERQKN